MSCPITYTKINGICYANCPNGTEALEAQPEICVSTIVCPPGTVADTSGLACIKDGLLGIVPKDTTCPSGYTEWVAGSCYINCSAYFLENGIECRRRITIRKFEEATCGTLFTLSGNNCTLDLFQLGILFLIIVAIVIYFVPSLRTFEFIT